MCRQYIFPLKKYSNLWVVQSNKDMFLRVLSNADKDWRLNIKVFRGSVAFVQELCNPSSHWGHWELWILSTSGHFYLDVQVWIWSLTLINRLNIWPLPFFLIVIQNMKSIQIWCKTYKTIQAISEPQSHWPITFQSIIPWAFIIFQKSILFQIFKALHIH